MVFHDYQVSVIETASIGLSEQIPFSSLDIELKNIYMIEAIFLVERV